MQVVQQPTRLGNKSRFSTKELHKMKNDFYLLIELAKAIIIFFLFFIIISTLT